MELETLITAKIFNMSKVTILGHVKSRLILYRYLYQTKYGQLSKKTKFKAVQNKTIELVANLLLI